MERWRACPDKISHATAHFTLGKQLPALDFPMPFVDTNDDVFLGEKSFTK